MCPEASANENPECINCRTKAECVQNALCCRSSCNAICKTPVNSKALSNSGGGEGPAGSRVCLKSTRRPLHQCTSSVRPTHLPEPPCNLLSNMGLEISELPRVLPNTRGRTSAKPHPQNGVFLVRGSVRWIQQSWGMKGLCVVRE